MKQEERIDRTQPVIDDKGNIQLRLITLICHPDYSLNLAFNGRGKIGYNRNAELDQMSIVDLILDAKARLEQEINKRGRFAENYAYAGFMTDTWARAIGLDLVIDEHYNREDYIHGNMLYNGVMALTLRTIREKGLERPDNLNTDGGAS